MAWCITGSGHYLNESLALCERLPDVDVYISAAGEEVLAMYGLPLETLRQRGLRLFRDKTASAIPVGLLYERVYHTVIIAPATSNTVAKCALGIADTLPTNLFAQAGKRAIPSLVFACDTEPVVVTKSPTEWFEVRPRAIDLAHAEALRRFEYCTVVGTVEQLEAALAQRLAELGLAWNISSS
nr:flavoprotein [Derxia lacustris]